MSGVVPRVESWRRDPRMGLLVIACGIAFVCFVLLTALVLLAPSFVSLDETLSEAIRGISLPGLEGVARFFTNLGSFWSIAILTLLSSALLFVRGRKSEALLLFLTVALGSLLGEGLKVVIHRVRPALEVARIALPESYSFPSGHTLTAVDFFGSLGFIALIGEKRLRRAAVVVVFCVVIALAIGMSRVYLGVHYLGDVLGGLLLGAAWVTFMIFAGAAWGAGSSAQD